MVLKVMLPPMHLCRCGIRRVNIYPSLCHSDAYLRVRFFRYNDLGQPLDGKTVLFVFDTSTFSYHSEDQGTEMRKKAVITKKKLPELSIILTGTYSV